MNDEILNELAKINSKLATIEDKLDQLLGTTAYKDRFTPAELRKYLKISRAKYERLLESGIIKMIETPAKGVYRKGHFFKSHIDTLIIEGKI